MTRVERPLREGEHRDTEPMMKILAASFRIHRNSDLTQITHEGVHPSHLAPNPKSLMTATVYDPPLEDWEVMSTEENDRATHKLSRIMHQGELADIVVCKNNVVRLLPYDYIYKNKGSQSEEERAMEIDHSIMLQELDVNVLGPSEILSILVNLHDNPNISFALTENERASLGASPLAVDMLKSAIDQLAQRETVYQTSLTMGGHRMSVDTRIPFDCEPHGDEKMRDSTANSSRVTIDIQNPLSSGDKLTRKWTYKVGRSRYEREGHRSRDNIRTMQMLDKFFPGEPGEEPISLTPTKEDVKEVLLAIARHRNPGKPIDWEDLITMKPEKWKAGMDIMQGLGSILATSE